jgi:hypothetical protein
VSKTSALCLVRPSMHDLLSKVGIINMHDGMCGPGLDSIVYGGMDWSGSLGFPHLPTVKSLNARLLLSSSKLLALVVADTRRRMT